VKLGFDKGGDNCLDLAFERGDKPEILAKREEGIVLTLPLAHVCL